MMGNRRSQTRGSRKRKRPLFVTRLLNRYSSSSLRSGRKRRFLFSNLFLAGFGPAQNRRRLAPAHVLPALVTALVVALALSIIRVDLIRSRYATAEATLVQQSLHDEIRVLTARMRGLRDPMALTEHAEQLGFAQPERLIHLAPDQNPHEDPLSSRNLRIAARNTPRWDRP